MKYNFDKLVVRRGTDCMKWDADAPFEGIGDMSDVIPMWVADMDFETAPCVARAVLERAQHPVFGYTNVPAEYYRSVVDWFSGRHGWTMDPSWILYTSGVVPAISAVIKALVPAGGKVAVMTPAYNCFFSSIRNNDCVLADCPLIYDHERTDGVNHLQPTFSIDYDRLESVCADPECNLLLFCNPHNPSGRVWTKDELEKVGEICLRHDVIIVSDEIHCEIVMPGFRYVPFASVSEEIQHSCITLSSSSKAFNTAGLQIANIISDNPEWRRKIDKAININEICDVNPFGHVALRAAYTEEGAEWLSQLNDYIWGNYCLLRDAFEAHLPEFPLCKMEGTYLAWFDCSVLGEMSAEEIENSLLANEKVWINAGTMYGKDGFMRINLAAPRSRVTEGVSRIVRGLRRLMA